MISEPSVKAEIPDILISAMALEIDNHDTVLHGVSSPLPVLAMSVARRTHAPDMAYVSGAGGVDPEVDQIFPSSFDPRLNRRCVGYFGLYEAFDLAQRGELNVMFLGAAQIDPHGNTNLSVIGDIDDPKVQLPGGAATAFLMPITPKVVVWITRHSKRTFVGEVDFVTGQGYDHRTEEQRANELTVITNLGVMDFKNDERRMQLRSFHPGVSADEIQEKTGFDLIIPSSVAETPVPPSQVLEIIRALDPKGVRWTEFK
jgi:glutaconate CoA-transferase subunit B